MAEAIIWRASASRDKHGSAWPLMSGGVSLVASIILDIDGRKAARWRCRIVLAWRSGAVW